MFYVEILDYLKITATTLCSNSISGFIRGIQLGITSVVLEYTLPLKLILI